MKYKEGKNIIPSYAILEKSKNVLSFQLWGCNVLIFFSTEARHVLSMFLICKKFEPQRSYKHGSYSRKSVYTT